MPMERASLRMPILPSELRVFGQNVRLVRPVRLDRLVRQSPSLRLETIYGSPAEWGNKRKAVHLSYYTPTDIFQHTRYEGQATVIYRGGGGYDHHSPRTGHRIDLDQQEKEVDRRG